MSYLGLENKYLEKQEKQQMGIYYMGEPKFPKLWESDHKLWDIRSIKSLKSSYLHPCIKLKNATMWTISNVQSNSMLWTR